MSILIKNGNVVFFDEVKKTDILIDGNRIAKIGLDICDTADDVIDATGLTIMAGLVDMHAHLREPGQEHKEDVESGLSAALRGGYTTVACMPNTSPVVDNPALVKYLLYRAAEIDKAKLLVIGAVTKGQNGEQLAEMGFMKQAGIVAVSDDGRPIMDAKVMSNALSYAKTHDLLLISHAEDLNLTDNGVVNEGLNSTISGLKGIPRTAEEAMIARDLIIAEYVGAKIHIAHVSTEGSVNLIRQAKKRGVNVSAETCPHYYCATDDEILSFNTNAKINPPLREDFDAEAIILGLKDGTIDCIATDHAPHHIDEKNQEFNLAPFGTIGLETAFALSYTHLVESGDIHLTQLSKLLSFNPSKILGIGGGFIAEGSIADLIIADLNKSFVVDSRLFKSKSKNTLFEGWHLKGEIVCTIVEGEIKDSCF